MRRTWALGLAAALTLAGAGAAHADAVDVVLVTATAGGLTLTGGSVTLPLGGVTAAIGDPSGANVVGGVMLVTDLRGGTSGWNVSAQYSQPNLAGLTLPGNLTAAEVSVLPAENIKVKTAAVTPAVGVTASYAGSFVSLPAAAAVKVVSAASGSLGGLTTFQPSYNVTIPASSALASVHAAQVTYTIFSGPATLATP